MGATTMALRWRLRELLLAAQVRDRSKTVTALAVAVGVSRTQASAWVNSEEMPDIKNQAEKLPRIAKFLGCSVSDLIEG